jgi:glycosyltransferase involved in cell wall biosynthesis
MSIVISAVICTHNRARYLEKAIQSLVDQHIPRDRYEIIIVDNCSTDATRGVVEKFANRGDIRYVYEPTLGLSHARNTGWRSARGKYVAYLDDDAMATPKWLETILDTFETVRPMPGCVGGKVDPIWEGPRPVWVSDEIVTCLTVIDWSDKPHFIDDIRRQWLVGANIAFPVKVLHQVDGCAAGLDRAGRRLLSSGDIFLEKQIIKAGYRCFYNPEILARHAVERSRLEKVWFRRRYLWQGFSDAAMPILEERPSAAGRIKAALPLVLRLAKSPRRLLTLLLPTDDPRVFTEKCFTWIALGHIAGLLGAVKDL